MYVRFITPWWRMRRGVDVGLFGPAYALWRAADTAEALRIAIRCQLDFFEDELRVPRAGAFLVKSRGRWLPDGICWFRDSAARMIAEGFILASLIREAGIPVTKVATDCPGQILYTDDHQIVAKPNQQTPVRFN